ncbi:MAG TPA: PspC domain-containing protein [Bacillota bacterium]|nr:PspC domain-containing protein [Bacillota bacterium]
MAYNQQLYRSRENRIIGGVAGGLANYFRMDVSLVRLLWILAVFFGGSGVLAYLIAWLVIPEEKTVQIHQNQTTDATSSHTEETLNEARTENRPAAQGSKLSGVGFLLIGLGIFFLFKDNLPWHLAKYAWPVFLIIFGVFLLVKRPRF